MLLILVAKGMGIFIVVDEDYYQKKFVDLLKAPYLENLN